VSDGLKLKYFVLNPNKDDNYGMASREAIRAYAHMIDKTNPELANDLWLWLDDIDMEIKEGATP
jgi:hypothetical protein